MGTWITEKVNYKKMGILWPLVSIARSDILNITQIAPFYRHMSMMERRGAKRACISSIQSTRRSISYRRRRLKTPIALCLLISTGLHFTPMGIMSYVSISSPFMTIGDIRQATIPPPSSIPYSLTMIVSREITFPSSRYSIRHLNSNGDETIRILHHLYIKDVRDGMEYIDMPFFYKESEN